MCPMTIKMPYGEECLPGLEACSHLFVFVVCKHVFSRRQTYITVLCFVPCKHGGQARYDVVH